MEFEAALDTLRALVGSAVGVNVTDERYGRADGYLADFSGVLTRVDEPIPGVDAPVYYFRLADEGAFALHEAMFTDAEWRTTAGAREFRIELRDGVVITVSAP